MPIIFYIILILYRPVMPKHYFPNCGLKVKKIWVWATGMALTGDASLLK